MNDGKKVYFVTLPIRRGVGGTSTWQAGLASHLADLGHAVSVFYLEDRWRSLNEVEGALYSNPAVKVKRLRNDSIVQGVEALRAEGIGEGRSVVISHAAEAYYALQLTEPSTAAAILPLHTDHGYYYRVARTFCDPAFPRRPSVLVPVSTQIDERLKPQIAAEFETRVINYGVKIGAQADWSDDAFRLVYVGRFVENQKRISRVVEETIRACREHDKLEVDFVGAGPEEQAMRDKIEAAGLETRMRVVGSLQHAELHERLSDYQGLVLLSDYEGFPICVLEAMAHGVVPFVRDMASGIREIVEDGRDGWVLGTEPGALAASVGGIIGDRECWQSMSAEAYRKAKATFSEEHSLSQWAGLVSELFESPPDQTGAAPLASLRQLHVQGCGNGWVDASLAGGLRGRRYALQGWFWRNSGKIIRAARKLGLRRSRN